MDPFIPLLKWGQKNFESHCVTVKVKCTMAFLA